MSVDLLKELILSYSNLDHTNLPHATCLSKVQSRYELSRVNQNCNLRAIFSDFQECFKPTTIVALHNVQWSVSCM